MNDVLLVGSGPSAQDLSWGSLPDFAIKIACVNDSYKLCPVTPHYYLVAEIPAAASYLPVIRDFIVDGKARIYMRPAAAKVLLEDSLRKHVTIIDKHFGPPELHELHKARPLPRVSTGPRPNAPWISSGVLMLWVLAELYQPERIYVAGLDGYPPAPEIPEAPVPFQGDTHIEGEYAQGITPLESRPFRTPAWTEAMNKLMAAGINSITNHYTQTEFVWLSRPNHYRESWRVSIKGD